MNRTTSQTALVWYYEKAHETAVTQCEIAVTQCHFIGSCPGDTTVTNNYEIKLAVGKLSASTVAHLRTT